MQTVNQQYVKNHYFIDYVETVLRAYDEDRLGLQEAAKLIYVCAQSYQFEDGTHPMLGGIEDLAFDIYEEYRTDRDDEESLEILRRILVNYKAGNFTSTKWVLSLTYTELVDTNPVHSFGASVSRQNGVTEVICSEKTIKEAIEKSLKDIPSSQTDERYLQNLTLFVPQKVGKHTLTNAELHENLVYETTT